MLLDQLSNLLNEGIQTSAFFVDDWRTFYQGHEGAISIFYAHGCRAFATFYDNLDLTVVLFLRLQNAPQRTNTVDLFGRWLINRGVVLGCQKNRAICGQGLLQRAH